MDNSTKNEDAETCWRMLDPRSPHTHVKQFSTRQMRLQKQHLLAANNCVPNEGLRLYTTAQKAGGNPSKTKTEDVRKWIDDQLAEKAASKGGKGKGKRDQKGADENLLEGGHEPPPVEQQPEVRTSYLQGVSVFAFGRGK